MRKREKRRNVIFNIVKDHIENNLKQYLIISLLFIIGTITAVIVVNNTQLQIKQQNEEKIMNCINELKNEEYEIDFTNLLKSVVLNNSFLAFLLWFLGCSVIGIPLVYVIIVYKGFSLGYTISSIITILGVKKGLGFNIITLLLQNFIIIPAILTMAVSRQ